jgi:hypothetical protein
MKKTYVFNVSKTEYGTVRVTAHSDEEADDRLKEQLEEENVTWEGKPEYSWDLKDIVEEGVDAYPEDWDEGFGIEKDDE